VRVQALAFLVFLIFAGTCFGIIHTVNYFADQRELAKWRESMAQLHRAYAMFGSGDFDNAFGLVEKLQIEHPFETRITVARDSLFVELREMADDRFRAKEFEAAATYYAVLSQKQKPQRLEVTLQLSRCYYYLEKYDKAIQSLEHVRAQQPWNLELLYEVGLIYYEKLDNPEVALRYFSEGKNLFIKNMSSVYGAAFEILINPKNVPTIYFDIFVMRGKANLRLNNDKEAITDFNWAVFLRPEPGEPYRLRAEGEIRIKDFGEACEDLVMAARRGIAVTELQRLYCR
jgi:tetratricopeptide (TPR) repeat protein